MHQGRALCTALRRPFVCLLRHFQLSSHFVLILCCCCVNASHPITYAFLHGALPSFLLVKGCLISAFSFSSWLTWESGHSCVFLCMFVCICAGMHAGAHGAHARTIRLMGMIWVQALLHISRKWSPGCPFTRWVCTGLGSRVWVHGFRARDLALKLRTDGQN